MKFAYTRLITDDLSRLVAFYHQLFESGPQLQNEKFAAFSLEGATLWLFSRSAVEELNGGEWFGGQNRSLVLEFEVTDVDQEYARITSFVRSWIHAPKIMPWGNHSMLFRDSDGNAINVFKRAPHTP